jgi:hypothetical protein
VQAESAGQVLYLRVLAKTAYVSSSRARMENPEPVDVDISKSSNSVRHGGSVLIVCKVLDPYLLNVLPESLLKIVVLIVVVVLSSWWLGGWIHRTLLDTVSSAISAKAGTKKDI